MTQATAFLPDAIEASAGPSQLERSAYRRVLHPINAILAAYLVGLAGLALAAWNMGHGPLRSAFVFGGFLAVNLALSALSIRSARRAGVELARIALGALLAPMAYLLAGDPFMRWWPGFLIMCLCGTVLLSLHDGTARWGRPLSAWYVALYVLAEMLAPAPHDWYMTAMNAGAIAFVALVFSEIVAYLGATIAAERARRAELAAEKARSESMLQREAADALRAREAYFRAVFENAFDITTIVDRDGVVLYATANLTRELGWAPEELVGKPYMPLIHPDDLPQILEKLAAARAAPGTVAFLEMRARHRDGGWRWIESVANASADGTLVSSSRNVTAKREAEEALQRLNVGLEQRVAERTAELQASVAETRRLAAIIEAASDYIGIADLEGRSLYVNRAGLQMVGKRAESMRGASVMDCYPPQSLPKVAQMVETVMRGEDWQGEVELRHVDGHIIPVSEATFLLRDAEGRPEALATIIRDISTQKRAEREITAAKEAAERALAESRRLASIIEATTDLVGTADTQFRITYMNRAGRRLMGFGDAQLLEGFSMVEAYPPDEFKRITEEVIPAALRDGRDATLFDTRIRTREGQEIPVSIVGIFHRDASGALTHLSAVIRDVSSQKRAETEITLAKEAAETALAESRRLTAILEATSDLVGVADANGQVIYINQAGRRMIGLEHETLDLDFARLFDAPTVQRMFDEGVPTALREGAWQTEVEFRHADGHAVPTSIVGLVHVGPDGRPDRLSCIARDITGQRRAQAELRQARDAAEAANRAKSTFLANMSHEIRTPMNAVIGMTSLLLDTPLSARQREFVEIVRTSGDALLTVINDILDFSKIEAEKLELVVKPFDLREAVEAALDLLAPRASEKGLELGYVVDDGVPEGILGDVTRLRQILVNLIGNAVKFTERGEIFVGVQARRHAAGGPGLELQFSVRDTGAGVPSNRIDRLFRPFSQLDASTTREHGGTGLGLAISKRLAGLMGGRIWVESEGVPGRGATFHFTIATEAAASPARSRRSHPLPALRGRRLLVVDDNATNRRILSLQAQTWGMQVTEAESPGDALALVRGGLEIDLAILDMHMPDGTGTPASGKEGLELAKVLCALRGAEKLPIVMLTSLGDSPDGNAESLACFAAHLSKPIKPSHLHDVLVQVLADGAQAAPAVEAPTPVEALAQRLPLRILLAEDVVVNQRFALLALERMGYRADVAANGLEVLAALARQHYDVVLMDVQMPELDGLEATRRIRRELSGSRQPQIVAMTANAMQGDRELCLQAGMDDYISKPVYLEELSAALERAGGRRRAAGAPALAESAAVDGEVLAELRHRSDAAELCALYLSDAARLTGDLERAAVAGDGAALARSAHALAGASAYVGARRLIALCRELEQLGRTGCMANAPQRVVETVLEFGRVRDAIDAPQPA